MLGSNSGNRFAKKREYTNLKHRLCVSIALGATGCNSLLFPALLADASPDLKVDEVDVDGTTYLCVTDSQRLRLNTRVEWRKTNPAFRRPIHKSHPGNQRHVWWAFWTISVKLPGHVPDPGRLGVGRKCRAECAVRLREVGQIDGRQEGEHLGSKLISRYAISTAPRMHERQTSYMMSRGRDGKTSSFPFAKPPFPEAR